MKLSLLLALSLPIAMYAQDSNEGVTPYSSGAAKTEKFTNEARKFRDWSISVGGGTALMHSADLTSFHGGKVNWGWNAYASLNKQISHTFGLMLQYQMGETNQRGAVPGYAPGSSRTKYKQVSFLGDLNLTSLFRRVDNKSNYKWGLHAYAGIGIQGYDTHLVSGRVSNLDYNGRVVSENYERWPILGQFEQPFRADSFFYQGGVGLMYNVNRWLDIEGRVMYVITGDDAFDGSGPNAAPGPYTYVHRSHSDNYLTANLGLSFKLGKHPVHLRWYDPLQNAYARLAIIDGDQQDLEVCKSGDNDNDGVCDDWDRQLNTPAGARVDGAGVALDMDLDGVIDLYDKCVTVPGPAENNGCPTSPVLNVTSKIEEINKDFDGIEFALDKDIIRTQSFEKLNHAADVIKTLDSNQQFLVIGATDTRGNAEYNKKLSQRRADAVVKYLINKGVSSNMLSAEGRGKNDLKYPECDPATKCPEWKNEANRRVYFQAK